MILRDFGPIWGHSGDFGPNLEHFEAFLACKGDIMRDSRPLLGNFGGFWAYLV